MQVPDPDLGSLTVPGVVPRLSATPGAVRWAGRHIGADTRQVLTSLGGYTPDEVDALAAQGVVYCAPPPPVPPAAAQADP